MDIPLLGVCCEVGVCEVLLQHLAAVCFINSVVLSRSAVVIAPTQLACIVGLRGRYHERGMARSSWDPSRLSWPWGSAPSGSGGPSSAVGLASLNPLLTLMLRVPRCLSFTFCLSLFPFSISPPDSGPSQVSRRWYSLFPREYSPSEKGVPPGRLQFS